MKYLVNVAFLFITIVFYPQIKDGEVRYGLVLSEENTFYQKKDPVYMKAMSMAGDIEYILAFNQKESYFSKEESLRNEELGSKFASIFGGYLNPVYSNFQDKKFYFYPTETPLFKSNEYLIEEDIIQNWELYNESKMIGEYLCYKAITTVTEKKTNITEDKKFYYTDQSYTVTAWYCPQIPVSAGPLGYGGLPGLILELRTEKAVYGARHISLNLEKDPDIKPLTKGKKTAYYDYIKIFHNHMEEIQEQLKRNK